MLWTVAYQVPLSMGFSRQEYWGGLSWPPPGDLPNQGIEPMSPMSSAFSSIQFSHSVVSDSLQSHELQHIKLPCPSPTPRACSNSCPLSQWCHPTISSPVIPFSSCLQSFPESGSFPMSQIFTSGGQSIRVSASASVLPMNIQDWVPLGLTGSPCSPSDSQEFSPHSHQDSMVLAQRQKYRSVEQNRKPRDKPMHLWTSYLWQRRQEYTMEKRQSL